MPSFDNNLILGVGAGMAIGYGLSKFMSSQEPSKKSSPSGQFDLNTLVRPNIAALEAYRCARDDYDTGVLLDANENAYGPPIPNNEQVLERYPCPYQWALKGAVAKRRGVRKENVFVGVGSDEAIDMLIRIFCIPAEDSILVCQPTYGMYSVSADTNDVGIIDVPQTPQFQLQTDKVIETTRANSNIKLMFLCSPGNPSCALLNRDDIIKILEANLQCIVVVDEAYVDFGGEEASTASMVNKYPNLVVLQTMSKAFGLAGIRCGFAMGSEELIAVMSKVKCPYNVNKLTSKVALSAFDPAALKSFEATLQQVLAERTKMAAALKKLPEVQRVLPSDTNFLMFEINNASKVYKYMAEAGVVVRDRSKCTHCAGCLRVTIGTPEQNTKFFDMLVKTMKMFP